MNYFGVSANLMSLGGLAIALGLLVDGSVVMVENVDRMLREADEREPLIHIVARACSEVVRPIVLSLIIIIIVFLPLFTLRGVEGRTFRPLAQTMSFAMLGSLVFAVLLAPVLASLLMRRVSSGSSEHKEIFVVRGEVGAHTDPVNSAESFVALKPRFQWTTAENSDELVAAMSKAFENFPGVQFNFTQPIASTVDELLTGTKAELAIKIFGPEMDILKKKRAR